MFDDPSNLTAETTASNPGYSWEGKPTLSPTQPVARMTWLERYEALSTEHAVLSDRFSKGTLSPQQFAQLQGNVDQLAFLFAVYREAGFPDRNLPIEGAGQSDRDGGREPPLLAGSGHSGRKRIASGTSSRRA